jgi:hypothetical protein
MSRCRRGISWLHIPALYHSALHASSLFFFGALFAANWDNPANLSLPRAVWLFFIKEARVMADMPVLS